MLPLEVGDQLGLDGVVQLVHDDDLPPFAHPAHLFGADQGNADIADRLAARVLGDVVGRSLATEIRGELRHFGFTDREELLDRA